MKLYEEKELVDQFYKIGLSKMSIDTIMMGLNPVELPSDEEISEEFKHNSENWEVRQALEEGAKWMRDKIQGGNNE